MKEPKRTTIHIRRADEEIFIKLSQLNFGEFVSDMMNEHGPFYIEVKAEEQIERMNKLTG